MSALKQVTYLVYAVYAPNVTGKTSNTSLLNINLVLSMVLAPPMPALLCCMSDSRVQTIARIQTLYKFILLDYANAFDRIDHSILMKKLEDMDIPVPLLKC